MDKIKKKYFGTDGIRGKANSSSMNAELAINIGMATAEFFTRGKHKHYVLIGKIIGQPQVDTTRHLPVALYLWFIKTMIRLVY